MEERMEEIKQEAIEEVAAETVETAPEKSFTSSVQIADDVVAMIAGYATLEVDGVSSMAGSMPTEILGMVGYKSATKGIKVAVEDGNVAVDVCINMAYGYNIPATSSKVQTRIQQAIENMTGLTVTDVNVRIAGITFEAEKDAEEE